MTVLEIVNARVTSAALPADQIQVKLCVDEVEQAIKNYCNIDVVPEGLKYVWANMAMDLVRYHTASSKQDSGVVSNDISVGEVSSLKIGDTTVTLGSGSDTNLSNRAIKSHTPNLDRIVMNYKSHLNKYRRMVW